MEEKEIEKQNLENIKQGFENQTEKTFVGITFRTDEDSVTFNFDNENYQKIIVQFIEKLNSEINNQIKTIK